MIRMKLYSVKKACQIVDNAFLYVLKTIRIGESEKNLALRIDKFIKSSDARLAFPTIVASGTHSAFIHHKPCRRIIRGKEPILLDFGAKYQGFCSDLSRTVFIGEPNKQFKDIYNIVLRAQDTGIKKLKAGFLSSSVDLASRKVIAKAGFEKEFKHTLGHGLGMIVHQAPSISPNSKETLKDRDIVTIEPGIYIKGKGGVRVEDDLLVTKSGYKLLTKSPKLLKEVIIKA